jgi:hypothetical protein
MTITRPSRNQRGSVGLWRPSADDGNFFSKTSKTSSVRDQLALQNQQASDVFKELSSELEAHVSALQRVLTTDLAVFNRELAYLRIDPVVAR